MLKRLLTSLVAAAGVLTATALAAEPEIYTGRFSNLALNGYDAVAYFDAGAPAKGEKEFVLEHKGAEWRFISAENLEKFKANPDAYAPQYGGYCAWAVSQGYTAPGSPEAWKIVDGKLYLNYDKRVQADWEKDIPGFIAKANDNWPTVLTK